VSESCTKTDRLEGRLLAGRVLAVLLLAVVFFCARHTGVLPAAAQDPVGSADEDLTHLRGVVLNSTTHEPIARALVRSMDSRFATLTDDRGRFDFTLPSIENEPTPPPPNARAIVSSQTFYLPQPSSTRPDSLMARKPGFLATEGQELVAVGPKQKEVVLALVPESRVVGKIAIPGFDGSGRMQIDLYRLRYADGHEIWTTTAPMVARSDGEFRFVDLSAGSYKLLTHEMIDRDPLTFAPGGPVFGYPPVYYPSAADFDSAPVIRLAAGETFQATISPPKRQYHSVQLPVINLPPGYPVQVRVWPAGHPGPGYALGFNYGEHLVRGSLPDGTYNVTVAAREPTGFTGGSTITIKGGPVSGPGITLVQNISLGVTIREEFQHPHNEGTTDWHLSVQLIPEHSFDFERQLAARPEAGDAGPMVVSNVSPGRYRVRVNPVAGYVSSIVSGSTDLLHQPLVVGLGATPQPIEITLRDDGAHVEGTIEEPSTSSAAPDSAALRNTRYSGPYPPAVYFFPVSGSAAHFARGFMIGGKFRAQLAPGSYLVLAVDHSREELEIENPDLRPYESGAKLIDVQPEQRLILRVPLLSASE
jgi:hypothetical protein